MSDLLEAYRQAAIRYVTALDAAKPRSANKASDEARRLFQQVRRGGPEQEQDFLVLLDDIEPAVRLWAASHALDIAPDRAVPVLRALAAKPHATIRTDAELTLQLWNEESSLPQIAHGHVHSEATPGPPPAGASVRSGDAGEQAAAALQQAGLGTYAELIAPRAEPSIKLRPTRCAQAEIAMGASRFGGLPDLPPGFRWPMFHDTPLVFLAQLDLARLPSVAHTRLPSAGWLVFFYDMESWGTDPADRGSASVAYFEADPAELVRCAPPDPRESLVPGADIFAPCRLSFAEVVDMPDLFGGLYDKPGLELTPDEQDRYTEASMRLQQRQHDDEPYHHLLGWQQPIQDDMRRECQLAFSSMSGDQADAGKRKDASAGIHDWRLLLQLDTDEQGPGWMWGSGGRIYYWIRYQDLEARDFSKSWLILQCT